MKNAEFITETPLNFKQKFSNKTGEIDDIQIAELDNLKFELKSTGLLIITGSLHKFYNNGEHNYDDFSLSNLRDTLQHLEEGYSLELDKCIIQNIEVGVNIESEIDPKTVLDYCILYGNMIFSSHHEGHYKLAELSDYSVKIYNKGLQFSLNSNCLRFELKYRKMRVPNSWGLYNLRDLLLNDWINEAGTQLIEAWNKILFVDPKLESPSIGISTFYQWTNPHYWIGLKKMNRFRQKVKMNKCMKAHSLQTKEQIGDSIKLKWLNLSKCYLFTVQLKGELVTV